jgi:hypothetical protein
MRQLVVALTFLATGVGNAWSFSPPDGLRGHKWGSPPSELADSVIDEDDGDMKCYQRKDDDLTVGDAKLNKVAYCYYKERLYFCVMEFNGSVNFAGLKSTLVQKYGAPERPNRFMEEYQWLSPAVFIDADYHSIDDKGRITFTYVPISNEHQRDRAEKAKQGADKM